jgi:hypothetical protein
MGLACGQFDKEVKGLEDHIEFLEKIKNDIALDSPNFHYSRSSTRKRYDYNSIIISLYGIIESYTERFLVEYLDSLERNIFKYECLDESFKEAHFQKTMLLINKVIEGKHQKYDVLKKEIILENLNNCIKQTKPFVINKDAFFINTGNLKHSKICEIFKNIDISLENELRKFEIFKIQSENTFNKIDDIVQRRNEIAHGAVAEIIDSSEIYPLIEFLKAYFHSISEILEDKSENEINRFKKLEFGKEIGCFKIYNGNILGIGSEYAPTLSVNSIILIEKPSYRVYSSSVLSFKKFDNGDVTVKLDKNIKENCRYYIFDNEAYVRFPQNYSSQK